MTTMATPDMGTHVAHAVHAGLHYMLGKSSSNAYWDYTEDTEIMFQ